MSAMAVDYSAPRVIDADTHVNPSMDVLLRYADTPLRDRMDDLAPYLRKVKVSPGRGDVEDTGQASTSSSPGRGRTAGRRSLRTSRAAWSTPITATWRSTARRIHAA